MNSSGSQVSLQDSPDNHGTIVNVVSWFLLIVSSLVILTRLVTKWAVSKKFHADDGMAVISQVFGISQVVAISLGVANGLGRHFDTLTGDNIIAFEKCFYATSVLFVAGQASSKLSVVFFIRILSPVNLHRILTWILTGATILWALTSIMVLLFQCSAPGFWVFLKNGCINRQALWYYINVANVLLDACLTLLPCVVIWKLQAQLQRRFAIIFCFATRVLTIAAVIWQMEESHNLSNHEDPTFAYWPFVLSMALAQNLGVITACIPYLKPFLDSLESGLIRSDDIRRRANGTKSSTFRSSRKRADDSLVSSQPSTGHAATTHELRDLGYEDSRVTASITIGRSESAGDWENASHSSQAKLIKQVKTWGVTSSPAPGDND